MFDALHKKAIEVSKEILSGETVTMNFDGWSNVYNKLLICTSVIKSLVIVSSFQLLTLQIIHILLITYALWQNNLSWIVKKEKKN